MTTRQREKERKREREIAARSLRILEYGGKENDIITETMCACRRVCKFYLI